jgi:hypothetical protein
VAFRGYSHIHDRARTLFILAQTIRLNKRSRRTRVARRIAATPVGGAAVAAFSGIPDIDGLREFPEISSSVVGY